MMAALKMNPQIRAMWVAALRSGDFEQGREYLRCGGKMCCLGVLTALAIAEGVPVEVIPPDPGDTDPVWIYDDHFDYLPESVRHWAGLAEGNPAVWYDDEGHRVTEGLAVLNDDMRLTFAQIADAIEGVPA